MMPRILCVATVDLTVAKLLSGLLAAQRQAGYQVEVACAEGSYTPALRAQGYPVHAVPFQRRAISLQHPRALWRLYSLMRSGRYEIVHVHTPVAQVLGRIAARLAGVPIVIYTSHGFQFHESRPRWARWLFLALERWLGRWATDFLFTQSAEDAHTAAAAGLMPTDRIACIGNGVDVQRFTPASPDSALRSTLGLRPTDRVVGFVGRLVREKGVVELVRAMALVRRAVPEARLLLVGDTLATDGDRLTQAALREAIAADHLDEGVIFAGFREDIPALLPLMDVFVLPSWREGMPRTILEAMACGRPVVATDVRGSREEVVPEATGLLVPPRDVPRLAEAVVRILSDGSLAAAMGRAGRERAVQEFNERVVIARQLAVYRRLREVTARRRDLAGERQTVLSGPPRNPKDFVG